jgi:hypothetical protein
MWLLAVCWLGISGCTKEEGAPITCPADTARYAALPGLEETHHPALREELARIVSERATPALLSKSRAAVSSPTVPSSEGAAHRRGNQGGHAMLPTLFPEETLSTLGGTLERLYPAGRFELAGKRLRDAAELRRTYDAQRRRFRRVISDPGFHFGLQHSHGLAADTSFVEVARVVSRLEGLLAAELLHDGSAELAMEPLTHMFHTVNALARERHVVPRIAAVHLRAVALRVLEAIAGHPRIDRTGRRRLAAQLDEQLRNWPADEHAWIGDRALGLHTYELLRDGYLRSVMSYQEIREYRDEIGADDAESFSENIDRDEWFYLKTMREVIASCRQPYYRREALFRRIENDLEQLRDSALYPFVAGRILLLELESGHRLQALDRARCEAWRLALSIAAGEAPDSVPVNPLTGHRYVIERDEERVIVDCIDPEGGEPAAVIRWIEPREGLGARVSETRPRQTSRQGT